MRASVCADEAAFKDAERSFNAGLSQFDFEWIDIAEDVKADLEDDPETAAGMKSGCAAQPSTSISHLGPGL